MVLKPRLGIKNTATNEKFTRGTKQYIWTEKKEKLGNLKTDCAIQRTEKKEWRNINSVREIWNTMIVIMWVPEGEGRGKQKKNVPRNKGCTFPRF